MCGQHQRRISLSISGPDTRSFAQQHLCNGRIAFPAGGEEWSETQSVGRVCRRAGLKQYLGGFRMIVTHGPEKRAKALLVLAADHRTIRQQQAKKRSVPLPGGECEGRAAQPILCTDLCAVFQQKSYSW